MNKYRLNPAHWSVGGRSAREALVLILITVGLAACAARGTSGAGPQYSIDDAAIFGRVVTQFILPDGSEASLRQLNGRYSVKFHRYSRVIDIDKAVTVKFKSTSLVDGFSLVILEKAESNCAKQTQLLAVRGSEVRAWELGNCRADPAINISNDVALFDVPNGKMMTRYQFKGGQLAYGEVPYLPPTYESSDAPTSGKAAAVPATGSVTPSNQKAATANRRTETKVVTQAAHPIISSTMPVFKTKEQATRTIYLDK